MRRMIELLVAAALGALATFVVLETLPDSPTPHEESSQRPAAANRTVDPSGMARSVSFAARETFEVHSEPEALCPSSVPAVRGYVFHCEAIIEGALEPVAVEVSSPLGFYRVVSVAGYHWRGPN
jgi:hypothetical protein